ncbi:HIT domain-containing protein [Candidatus Woesearchaeota archaeon]|nr:HIT domain-containing protein [Candidatus Woesearchaeota archaeon]
MALYGGIMIQLSPEQQKAIDEQKAQCPFCKIIAGEIPAKQVFEDEKTLVILDINPATKGHMLVVPKDHYPIMPLIPPAVFDHVARVTKGVMEAAYDAMVCKGVTMFIANGGAAGQQSSHFMIHVIPRDDDDNITAFDIPKQDIPQAEREAVFSRLQTNLARMMNAHLQGKPAAPEQRRQKEITDETIIGIIEANPPLLQAVLESPEEFKQLAASNNQLIQLFKGKNIDEIISKILAKHGKQKKPSSKKHEDQISDKKSGRHGQEDAAEEEQEEAQEESAQEQESDAPEEQKQGSNLDDISKLFR